MPSGSRPAGEERGASPDDSDRDDRQRPGAVPAPAGIPEDLDAFVPILSDVVAHAASVDEIARWLDERPYVRSVTTEPYLLKSHPPQRRFIVELDLAGTHEGRDAIDVYTFDDGRFALRDVHPW